MAMFRW